MAGLEDGESLSNHLRTKKMVTEKYLARHFLRAQQSREDKGLDNVCWFPGAESPADGATKVKSETLPMLTLLESGEFRPGALRPLRGVSSSEPAR